MMKVIGLLFLCSFITRASTADLGEACSTDAECSGSVVNSKCDTGTTNQCVCQQGYKLSAGDTACEQNVVEDTCNNNDDCSTISNSECSTGQCRCKQGYKGSTGATTCEQNVVGDTCSANEDCSTTISNSECDTSGSQTCVCSVGHNASSDSTKCNVVDCGNPQNSAYFFATPTRTTYLGTVEVTGCATGYRGNPTKDNITCEASGQWEANTGCTIKECSPLNIGNGQPDTTDITYGTTVSITCNASYKLRGSFSLYCQSDENWTPDPPTCVQVTNPQFVNPPDSASVNLSIAENITVDTTIFTVEANDTDGDTLSYHMVPDVPDFSLNSTTGILQVAQTLDFDQMPREYVISLEAHDENNATASATLTVSLTDVNDNNPIFPDVPYTADVVEGLVGPTDVVQVTATDADSALFGPIQYSITSGNDETKFQITGSTGQITADPLDFATTSQYNLTVTAKDMDGGVGARETDVTVTVNVKTEVQFTLPSVSGGSTIDIMETTDIGTTVYNVSASDPDGDTLVYSMTSPSSKFTFNSTTKEVKVSGDLDFDSAPTQYTLTFEVEDTNGATSTASLTINLIDDNDNAPEFQQTPYNVDVREGPREMPEVFQVTAIDHDSTLNDHNKISFSIKSGDTDNKFSINATTGQISALSLDYASVASYALVIAAKDLDGASGALETTEHVTVNVLTAPKLTMPDSVDGSSVRVAEDIQPTETVVVLNSTDADGNNPTYSIVNQSVAGAFNISGPNLIANIQFDYESATKVYTVVIMVTDDSSQRLTSTGTLTCSIINVNDESPEFSSDHYNHTIKEKIGAHPSFLQVAATDLDEEDSITFSISGSTLFEIDAATGWISTTDDLVYQTESFYNLTVVATDMQAHTATAYVAITVTEETDPTFTLPNQTTGDTLDLPEDAEIGRPIYTIEASDVDGDTLTYSLTDGAPQFKLNTTSRIVSVGEPLDYDGTMKIHVLKFEVTDENKETATATAMLNVSLVDANDNEPVFSEAVYSVDAVEGLAGDTSITQVKATDDDSSFNDYNVIHYSIQGGNDEGRFTIDPSSGEINATTLQYPNVYNLTISAKDMNGNVGYTEAVANVVVTVRGDCGQPAEEGYTFPSVDKTSYEGSATTACATGYEGEASPTTIRCREDKTWTPVTGCVKKGIGSSCTLSGNECSLITYSQCGTGSKCTCKIGYAGAMGSEECTIAIGGSCSSDECTSIAYSECTSGGHCACLQTYIGDIGDTNCSAAVGSTCTNNGDECASVTNGECGVGDKCSCKMGYIGKTGDLSCKAAVGATCTKGGTECDSVAHTECGQDNTCSCKFGYAGNLHDESCAEIPCGGQPDIPHTSSTVSKSADVVSATYSCVTGYQLKAGSETTRKCTPPATTWSDDNIECELKGSCSADPPDVQFSTFSVSADGNTVTYTCNMGYKLKDEAVHSTTCNQDSSQWNTPAVICEAKDCGSPDAPENGIVTLNEAGVTTFGASANITCANGYDISGGPTFIICEANEMWTQTEVQCSLKDCGQPQVPAHGSISAGLTTFGAARTQSCDEGYDLSGETETRCQEDGLWSADPVTCTIRDCGKTLPQPSNGVTVLDVDDVSTFGAKATQSCNDGYTPSGEPKLTCPATAQWPEVTLNCTIKDCGTKPNLLNGDVMLDEAETTTFGAVAILRCKTGYDSSNNQTEIECNVAGQWEDITLTCDMKDCEAPPTPTNGNVSLLNGTTTFGSIAEQSCDLGYTLAGSALITCLAIAEWSAGPVTCTIKDCGRLYAPVDGFVNGMTSTSSSQYGDSANFTCREGFALNGTSQRKCQHDATWSETGNPTCEVEATCGTPKDIPHAEYVLNADSTEATYTCNNDYKLRVADQNTLTCATQEWEGQDPECVLKDQRKVVSLRMRLGITFNFDFTDLRVKRHIKIKCQIAIQAKIRQDTGNDNILVYVKDVRIGSLDADIDIVIPDTEVDTILDATSNLITSDDTIEIDGHSGQVQSMSVDNVTYTTDNVDSYRCAGFLELNGPCPTKEECVVTDGKAACSPKKESDNVAVIIGVGVGVPLGLLLFGLFAVLCIHLSRERGLFKGSSSSEESEEDRPTYPYKMAKRFTGGYEYQNPAFYGQQLESYQEAPYSSRRPAAPGEHTSDSNFSWDFLYNQYPPGRKFEIRRPKY